MRELNSLIYNTIKVDSEFQTLTGATVKDPRIYKSKTPTKLPISIDKSGYSVYYKSGSIRVPIKVNFVGQNDYVYSIETYAIEDTRVESINQRLEQLFMDKEFETTSYIIGYTYATRGIISFDDSRQLYFEPMTITLRNILAKSM